MPATYHAVLIGNCEFPDEPGLAPLRCPLNDVQGMAELLRAEQHGPYEVAVLEDRDHHIVHREIYRALKRAERDDRVLIYYAGHGKINEDDGSLYLAAHDTKIEDLPASSVAVADIMRYMNNSASKQLILILDCCYSGAIDKLLPTSLHRGEAADQIASNLRGTGGSGSYILTASTSLQRAEEREGDHHGLLTKHVIAGIRDGKADRDDDGLISMHELTLYVQDQVRAEGRQTPLCYTLREEDGGLVIAKTGKAARSRKLADVQDQIYAAASNHRASLRTVRCALSLLVPEPTAPAEDKAICNQFVDQLHAARNEIRAFVDILEDAPALASRLAGTSTALLQSLQQERDEARLEAQQSKQLNTVFAEESSKLADQFATTRAKLQDALQTSASRASSLAAAQEQLAQETRLRREAQAELLGRRNNAADTNKRIEDLSATSEQLSRDLAAQTKKQAEERRRAKEQESDLNAVRNTLVDLGKHLQDATEARDALTREHADLQRQLVDVTQTREAAESNLQKVRKQLTAEKHAREAAETKLAQFKKQNSETEAQKKRTQLAVIRPTPAQKDQALLAVLSKYTSESDFYVTPKIPADKLANASAKCGLSAGTRIFALVNCTIFGSAKDCVLFGADAFHWHDSSGAGAIPYAQMDTGTITVDGTTALYINGRRVSIAGAIINSAKVVLMLKEIVGLPR